MPGNLESIASFKAKKEKTKPETANETGQLEVLRQEILREFNVDLNDPKNIDAVRQELRLQGKNRELAKLIKAHIDWLKYKATQKA